MMLLSAVLGAVWARSAYALIAEREEPAAVLLKRPRSPPRPPARPLPTPSDASECPAMPAIRWTGTQYVVSRVLLEHWLAEPYPVTHSARIFPSLRNGRHNGFRIFAIRPDSLYAWLGLQNGDTVLAVNGLDLSTPDKLLEAYTSLRKISTFAVRIERHGKLLTLRYRLC